MLHRMTPLLALVVGVTLSACAGDDMGDTDTDATTAGTTDATTTTTTTTTAATTETTTDATTTDATTTTTTDATTTTTTDATTTTTDATTTTTTTDATTGTTDDTTTTGGALGPFEMDVYPILMANCSCHVGGSPAGLSLANAQAAHDNLVDVASSQVPALSRVAPNDPESSYLLNKLNGTHLDVGGSGGQMPKGMPPLDPADINTIIDWINAGAPF